MRKSKWRKLEPIIEDVLKEYGIDPYKPTKTTQSEKFISHRSMLPQDLAKAIGDELTHNFNWRHFLNQFHVWRFHFQLYDALNNRFSFHYSYQGPGYWTPIDNPRAQKAIMNDPILSKHIDEDGRVS